MASRFREETLASLADQFDQLLVKHRRTRHIDLNPDLDKLISSWSLTYRHRNLDMLLNHDSGERELAELAILYVIARDEGVDAALLWRLSRA